MTSPIRHTHRLPLNRPIRVCAVSFLNARPLYAYLTGEHAPLDTSGRALFDVSAAVPSECARRLEAGECDVGLVPVAAYAAHPDWEVVPGIGIASRGPVQTVLLLSQVALERIRHIHLDAASRSSSLLLRELLHARRLTPTMDELPHGAGANGVADTTAALVIGDAAFGLARSFEHVYDLGAWWFRETALPFVFAFWAARPGVLMVEHVLALQHARDRGLKHAEELARDYRRERLAAGLSVEPEHVYGNYLRQTVRYGLTTHEREGMVEFLARARHIGLITIPGVADDEQIHVRFAGIPVPEVLRAARRRTEPLDVDILLARAANGDRIDLAEGMFLYEHAELMALGAAADQRRKQLHPEPVVTYIVDRNVNYTNVCVTRCKFCNFYTPPGAPDGYVLDKHVLAHKFRETVELGGVQILLQGGLNPELRLSYYEDLFRWTKANFPLNLHALSPTEIIHIAQLEDMSVAEVLSRLAAAGLDSVPGGGAEILDDEVRNRISPFKNSTDEWLHVMREAHRLGMRTTATMVFGFQERSEHILLHLERIRSLQDETAGFTAFIVWPFQAEGTRLKLRDDTSPVRYLRIQALARLYLDNVPNVQVSWPTLGPEIGEVALRFGANDFGSVMIEENVVSTAGAHFMMTSAEIEHHIRRAGFRPARRNMQYHLLGSPS